MLTRGGGRLRRLARYGNVYPIGTKERTVTLAGRSWDLWVGWNGAMRVYSFVVPSGTVKSFSADVKEFFRYLESNYQYPSSQQNLIGESCTISKARGDDWFTDFCLCSVPSRH